MTVILAVIGIGVGIVLAGLPGIPSAVLYALAGWTGMRVSTFLLLDISSAAITTGVVAGLGYTLGQQAVDAVLLVDRYAVLVSIAVVTLSVAIPAVKRWIHRSPARS